MKAPQDKFWEKFFEEHQENPGKSSWKNFGRIQKELWENRRKSGVNTGKKYRKKCG